MLTEEDDVEIHALARRGWSVSAIARHTGRDRKTVAKYLAGKGPEREPAPTRTRCRARPTSSSACSTHYLVFA